MKSKSVCAIYTRKSSDEGLNMEFNSLDAQREACSSYILSQKSEGWVECPTLYNDGGFSGGSLERPALKRLLDDITASKVNIIVVYKIDRLTRSLIDFSKLVEVFDQHSVTFVSITQSFNTTTSMGRLTLNVLLSFAQFEREIAGERIRDKIEASKRKGMWMGGTPPTGYKIENRQLVVVPEEASLVQLIFQRYAELKNVTALQAELTRTKVHTPKRLSINGKTYGSRPFSRGNLYKLLKSPAYIGKVPHKGKSYDGLHEGIICPELWQQVQNTLAENAVSRSTTTKHRHMLAGKIFTPEGTLYTPTYTDKQGRQYRYYLSQHLINNRHHPHGLIARLPCDEIEQAVIKATRKSMGNLLLPYGVSGHVIEHILGSQHLIPDFSLVDILVKVVTMQLDRLHIEINRHTLPVLVHRHLNISLPEIDASTMYLEEPYNTKRARNGAVVIHTPNKKADIFSLPSDELKRLVQGISWRNEHFQGIPMKTIAAKEGYSEAFVRHTINKSFDTLMQSF